MKNWAKFNGMYMYLSFLEEKKSSKEKDDKLASFPWLFQLVQSPLPLITYSSNFVYRVDIQWWSISEDFGQSLDSNWLNLPYIAAGISYLLFPLKFNDLTQIAVDQSLVLHCGALLGSDYFIVLNASQHRNSSQIVKYIFASPRLYR